MCDTISAFCAGVTLLGPFGGIEMRMRSNRSPTVSSFQFDMKSEPDSAGAKPSPDRSLPWQLEHSLVNVSSPRLACSGVNTPSLTERVVCARRAEVVVAATSAAATRRTKPFDLIYV